MKVDLLIHSLLLGMAAFNTRSFLRLAQQATAASEGMQLTIAALLCACFGALALFGIIRAIRSVREGRS